MGKERGRKRKVGDVFPGSGAVLMWSRESRRFRSMAEGLSGVASVESRRRWVEMKPKSKSGEIRF